MRETERKMTRMVRALRGGQITIPAEFRKQLGLTETSLLQMTLEGGELRITPVRLVEGPGSPYLKQLYDYFAPVRAEGEARAYTEDEINDAIDQAVAGVREHHATRRS